MGDTEGRYRSPFDVPRSLSLSLREAARLLAADRPALSEWVRDEAVHADEAESLAERTSDLAMTSVQPVYRPSTRHAHRVADEALSAAAEATG
jgi:hypothetical protein